MQVVRGEVIVKIYNGRSRGGSDGDGSGGRYCNDGGMVLLTAVAAAATKM